MSNFFLEDPRFPTGISDGSAGGPAFNTRIVQQRSGKRAKERVWKYPLHTYNVLTGIKTATGLEDVREFFYVMFGRDGYMRYKDFSDWKSSALKQPIASSDQLLGVGDGTQAVFEIKKTYQKGALSMERVIDYALNSTLLVEVGGVPTTGGWTQLPAPLSRFLQFSTGSVPATGQEVRAGYEFDVVVDFGIDVFDVTIQGCDSRDGGLIFNVSNLPLNEARLV